MATSEPVVIARYPFRAHAEAARLRLEAEGIPAFLGNAEVVDMDWFLSNAIGWVQLLVPGSEAERAATILRSIEQHRLLRRWRRSSQAARPEGDDNMAERDDRDDLEREIYGLKLHVATLYRLLTLKGISTPDEIQTLMEKIDAEDGASDGEFFGDVTSPPTDPT